MLYTGSMWKSTCEWYGTGSASYCRIHDRGDPEHTIEMEEWIESNNDSIETDDEGFTVAKTGLHYNYKTEKWTDPVLERIKRAHRRALNHPRPE